MSKRSSQLEVVFSDFDPLVCAAAEGAFATVLAAHPTVPVRVQVVQGNMLATVPVTGNTQVTGYDDYLNELGYSQDMKRDRLGTEASLCQEPVLCWDSQAGRMSVVNDDNAVGSSGSSRAPSCAGNGRQIYVPQIDNARTFLVYGANSAGVACGNAQIAVSRAFPAQFEDIHTQILEEQHPDMQDDFWPLDTQGRIYASRTATEQEGGASLCAAVVFPRAHDEYGNTRDVFSNALRLAVSSSSAPAKRGNQDQIVRVVTHALGTFTGHLDPPQFAESMAAGLDHYIKSDLL